MKKMYSLLLLLSLFGFSQEKHSIRFTNFNTVLEFNNDTHKQYEALIFSTEESDTINTLTIYNYKKEAILNYKNGSTNVTFTFDKPIYFENDLNRLKPIKAQIFGKLPVNKKTEKIKIKVKEKDNQIIVEKRIKNPSHLFSSKTIYYLEENSNLIDLPQQWIINEIEEKTGKKIDSTFKVVKTVFFVNEVKLREITHLSSKKIDVVFEFQLNESILINIKKPKIISTVKY